jgi:esterase/lipase
MEELFYLKHKNKNIACVLHSPEKYNDKFIIICHGFGSSKTGAHNMFTMTARKLCSLGYKVLRFDFPCNGDSEGKFADNDFNEWTDTLVNFTTLINHSKLGILGNSLGGACAIHSLNKAKINALVTWVAGIAFPVPENSKFIELYGIKYSEERGLRVKWKFWEEIFKIDFKDEIQKISIPAFMAFASHDKYVPIEKIKDISIPKNIIVRIYDTDHSISDYDLSEDLIKRTVDFFDKTLS